MNNSEAEKSQKANETLHTSSVDNGILDKLQNLLNDPDFLKLKRKLNDSSLNLFSTLAVSHRELWHSAFVKWILDPRSATGLDDFPLKRFFNLVLKHSPCNNSIKPPELSLGDIEKMNIKPLVFTTEYPVRPPGEGDDRKIDVFGLFHTRVPSEANPSPNKVRLIIENKVDARENNGQTKAYANWVKEHPDDCAYNFFVFLAPKIYGDTLTSDQFVQITYQEFVDDVLHPCLRHPNINQESKYWLEQYLLNLGIGIKQQKPMAKTNKEICKKIYEAHKTVFDEIFSSVNEGKLPDVESENQTKKHFDVSLEELIERKILKITDTLNADYNGKHFTASIIQNDDLGIGINCNGTEYNSPSAAGFAVTKKSTNGWTFWQVKDQVGQVKGTLSELRGQFLKEVFP
jgi:hypothetical protein